MPPTPLTITDCKVTTSSITLYFSAAVNKTGPNGAQALANYTVYDGNPSSPYSTPLALSPGGPGNPTIAPANVGAQYVTITFNPSTFSQGDWVTITVSNLKSGATTYSPATAAARVDAGRVLRIVNCMVTPSEATVYFSEPLDLNPGGSNDPNKLANYALYTQGPGGTLTPVATSTATWTPTYDPSSKVTTLSFPPGTFSRGQWVSVVVKHVTSGGTPILNGGNDTFDAQVDGDARDWQRRENRAVTKSVEDAVSYPLLTEPVSFPSFGGGPTTSGGGVAPAGGGVALDARAALAVGDVLGWKVNASDPKGFIGALSQAFTLNDVEGHIESTWNPRTYAVQTDLGGGITGAQASLYTRAQDAVQQSLQLLDGLYPLDPDADPEYVKALREMAKSQMNEILKEFGAVGGPSVLRVNTYFQVLLGQGQQIPVPAPGVQFDPDSIDGTLGTLRDTYGIYFTSNPFSNSIQDEQDITNFRVISDYMTSLLQSWVSNYQFFVLGTSNPAFFGTQLVLISRQFSVISESVNEVRFTLDSVFIGPSERQTLLLEFRDPNTPAIFLEDMLQEIQDFASGEGPRLLQDGGKISIPNNILPVMKNFRHMVHLAHTPVNFRQLPDGFRTIRVQRSLDDLHDQIKALIELAQPVGQQVPPPTQEPLVGFNALCVTPNPVQASESAATNICAITIMGQGFRTGPALAVSFSPGTPTPAPSIGALSTSFLSENLLVAQISVTGVTSTMEDSTYTYDVTVTNGDGTTSILRGGLSVAVTE